MNLNLNISHNLTVENAYIITIKGNATSETFSKQCQESCEKVGQPYTVWQAFDGTKNDRIEIPPQFQGQSWLSWFKWTDRFLSISEVACALSHISLWIRCLEINKPIVILEHDTVMVQPYTNHICTNTICYLGGVEQVYQGWDVKPCPPHASNGDNYHFICRAHAYAIDPLMAKNLVSHVLKYGINESLDMMMRTDVFSVVQCGIFAHDFPDKSNTTITGRKTHPDGTER